MTNRSTLNVVPPTATKTTNAGGTRLCLACHCNSDTGACSGSTGAYACMHAWSASQAFSAGSSSCLKATACLSWQCNSHCYSSATCLNWESSCQGICSTTFPLVWPDSTCWWAEATSDSGNTCQVSVNGSKRSSSSEGSSSEQWGDPIVHCHGDLAINGCSYKILLPSIRLSGELTAVNHSKLVVRGAAAGCWGSQQTSKASHFCYFQFDFPGCHQVQDPLQLLAIWCHKDVAHSRSLAPCMLLP